MKLRVLLLLTTCAVTLIACGGSGSTHFGAAHAIKLDFDSQGHRGARGLWPENSIAGARSALDHGMRTIELDVVVSADSVLIVSHEPSFNPKICDGFEGDRPETSFFQLTASEIQRVDCGGFPHPDFAYQQQAPAPRPTLAEFVRASEAHATESGRALPQYNIEIKSDPAGDGTAHPAPATFASLLVEAIDRLGIRGRSTVQSFDPRPLAWLARTHPDIRLGGLCALPRSADAFDAKFGDGVDVYSPYHLTLTRGGVAAHQKAGRRVVPWTVNDKSRMRTLLSWGVDGIITDYPDRLRAVLLESR